MQLVQRKHSDEMDVEAHDIVMWMSKKSEKSQQLGM